MIYFRKLAWLLYREHLPCKTLDSLKGVNKLEGEGVSSRCRLWFSKVVLDVSALFVPPPSCPRKDYSPSSSHTPSDLQPPDDHASGLRTALCAGA